MEAKKRIRLDFSPVTPERGGQFAVEKSINGGAKHRYLSGISSGISVDGHGERMTEHCIESFHEQAMKGNVLMYAGLHGVTFTDDLGMLVESSITPEGDWATTYRLYDESDGIGPAKLEKADDTWKQAMGLPPYTQPKTFGFSIEGDIPEGGIQTVDSSGRRVIDDVILDGVVLVKRPAYRASIAHGVYKALGEIAPWHVRKNLESVLQTEMNSRNKREEYYSKYYALDDAMRYEINRIMGGPDEESRRGELDDLYNEYKKICVELTLNYPEMFAQPNSTGTSAPVEAVGKTDSQFVVVAKRLEANLMVYRELMLSTAQKTGAKNGKEQFQQGGKVQS